MTLLILILLKDIRSLGAPSSLSLAELLIGAYPEFEWDMSAIQYKSPFTKKSQHLLQDCLTTLFPNDGLLL